MQFKCGICCWKVSGCPSIHPFVYLSQTFRSTVLHVANLWKCTPSALDWSAFKSLCNQYRKLILTKTVLVQLSLFSSWQTQNVGGNLSSSFCIANLHQHYHPFPRALADSFKNLIPLLPALLLLHPHTPVNNTHQFFLLGLHLDLTL